MWHVNPDVPERIQYEDPDSGGKNENQQQKKCKEFGNN